MLLDVACRLRDTFLPFLFTKIVLNQMCSITDEYPNDNYAGFLLWLFSMGLIPCTSPAQADWVLIARRLVFHVGSNVLQDWYYDGHVALCWLHGHDSVVTNMQVVTVRDKCSVWAWKKVMFTHTIITSCQQRKVRSSLPICHESPIYGDMSSEAICDMKMSEKCHRPQARGRVCISCFSCKPPV